MKRSLFLLFILLFIPSVMAVNTDDTLSITLLSASQLDNGTLIGGTAKLYLQLRPGHGAIFIESYPLSKIDTQVATRLANEIACKFTTVNCNDYDFFYTIRADSSVIGGPSAGGATALLTLAALEDIPLKDNVAMTGAISSGGIITPVGAVKEKLIAADLTGYDLAIAPLLSFSENKSDNNTITFEEIKNLSIQVEPVLTLQEALTLAAKGKVTFPTTELKVSEQYAQQMKTTSQILCDRASEMQSSITLEQKNNSIYTLAENFLNQSEIANEEKDYYARASFCYSANINLRELLVENLSLAVRLENKKRLTSSLASLEKTIDNKKLNVFSDLETYFVVKERILEAQQYMDEINDSNISSRLLALAIERYYSAVAWSEFFDLPGDPLIIDDDSLRLAALQEFQQVESRIDYLRLYIPEYFLDDTQEQLDQAKEYFRNEQYALALFKATKTSASANSYLSTITLTKENAEPLVLAKLDRAKEIIASQQSFPILGYSYYEYSSNLVESDTSLALLYSEYALAFSDLDTYFSPAKKTIVVLSLRAVDYYLFFGGLALGLLILVLRESFIKRHTKK